MNQDKYVFAQLIEFLDNDKFRRIVAKYGGDRYVKHFTCWNQLLVMMFGQLTNRESLRDLIVIIEAHRNKCSDSASMSPRAILRKPTRTATAASSRSLPTPL